MKKLGIVGAAGGLGSTMAFYLGLQGFFEEIALVDVKENVVGTHVIDLTECFSEESPTRVTGGGWDKLAGCDLVIMAAAAAGGPVKSRNEYLAANLKVVRATAARLKEYCPEAPLITATAPVDVFNMVFHREMGGDRHRFLGFCRNDSQRFRWAVSAVLGVDGRRVGGLVLGEHGDTQVPIFSTVTLDGQPANLTPAQVAAVEKILGEWYGRWQALESGRTTTWTSATSIRHMIASLLVGDPANPTIASVIAEGEYGHHGVSLGLPVAAGRDGWRQVLDIPLTDREREALAASAERVRSLYALT